MTVLNKSIREQEDLLDMFHRAEWTSMSEDERLKLEQQIAFNKKEQELYIMRTSKTILSILHRGFNKIKHGGRVMVLDEKAAEKLYNRLHLEKSDGDSYKIALDTEKGISKDVLSPGDKWLTPNVYLKTFGKKFIKDMGFGEDEPKGGAKSKIPKKRKERIEWYIEETDDNAKQFAMELNNYQQVKTIKIILYSKISSIK